MYRGSAVFDGTCQELEVRLNHILKCERYTRLVDVHARRRREML
jgi:hypothetical protein